MPMLDANDPAFREQYPNWAKVYDAWGRELRHVKACNPETGEVISYGMGWIAHAWYRLPVGKGPNGLCYIWRLHRPCPWETMSPSELIYGEHELLTRHGFWPAPLRVVPLGGPVPAGVPCRVGGGARGQRVDITAAEIYARARANKLMAGLALPDELINPVEGEE